MSVKIKEVYAITDRASMAKAVWSRVGTAFVNKDDSLNVVLDAIPLSGRLQIREKSEFAPSAFKKEVHREEA